MLGGNKGEGDVCPWDGELVWQLAECFFYRACAGGVRAGRIRREGTANDH